MSIKTLLGRTISDAEIIATFNPSEEGNIMPLAPNLYDKGVADYFKHYEVYHDMCPEPFGGIEALLQTLKEKAYVLQWYLARESKALPFRFNQFRLENYFEFIEKGMPSGPRKREGIQLVLDQCLLHYLHSPLALPSIFAVR